MFIYQAKADRTSSCAIGSHADVAKRHDIKAVDVQERRVHLRIENKDQGYGFDTMNIYIPPSAPGYADEDGVLVRGGDGDHGGGRGKQCPRVRAQRCAAIVAEMWPQFLEVPSPMDHIGCKEKHGQRSWAIAAAWPRGLRTLAKGIQRLEHHTGLGDGNGLHHRLHVARRSTSRHRPTTCTATPRMSTSKTP